MRNKLKIIFPFSIVFLYLFFAALAFYVSVVQAKTNTPVLDLSAFIFRNDDGSETSATSMAATSTNASNVAKNTNFRLRFQSYQSASSPSPTTDTPLIQYNSTPGASCTAATGWVNISTSSSTNLFAMAPSSNFTDKSATTNQLGSPAGGSTFIAGEMLQSSNPADAWTYSNKSFSEHEWNMIATNNASYSTTYTFRVTNNGTAYNTYTTCPQLTTAAVPSTTLGDGTNPSNVTIGPGSAATSVDAFTFQTNVGTDNITAATVSLASGTHAYLSNVAITSDNGATTYGSSTNPSSDSLSITLSGLTANTTLTQYRITITPLSATAMPAPPGGTYYVTSTITGWTGTNTQAGSDGTSATVTIDNQSPGDVTGASGNAGDAQVSLSWTNPTDPDLNDILVLRSTSTVVATPTEGVAYSTSSPIGASIVACFVPQPGTSCTDAGLTNGTLYYYKIFTDDNYENYSATGTVPTGSPFTPTAGTVSCSASTSTTAFGTIDANSVYTSSPNVVVSSTCTYSLGCIIKVNDTGNGSSPGLYKSTSPTYLIPSANGTLSAGVEGYGIQATTTAAGITINPAYSVTGNAVGGLTIGTVTLASSSATYTGVNITVTHEVSLQNTSYAGSYSDAITYGCTGN